MPRAQRGLPTKRKIPGVKKVLVVASGKGGVGKSTVAVNLAMGLAHSGTKALKVGLLDLDIFGPSIPKLMNLETAEEPELTRQNKIIPIPNYGISCMSIGFLLPSAKDTDTAVVWRGMMVMKAVQQLLFDVHWATLAGEDLDVLVIDLPPGTGDVHLSLCQLVEVTGAVIVSTPQDVALIDARKGVAMFKKANVPILGSVLNMAAFICPSCTDKHEIFGPSTSFEAASKSLGMPVLAQIPLEMGTSVNADHGKPVLLGKDGQTKQAFVELADKVIELL